MVQRNETMAKRPEHQGVRSATAYAKTDAQYGAGTSPANALGTAAEEMSSPTDRENIRFNVLRNALYHTARRRTMERWNRIFNFLVIALGTAAVGNALVDWGVQAYWGGMAVAITGALQLVLDFGGQARNHQLLQRDYYLLLADIEEILEATEEQRASWQGRMIRITADEPPMLRAIDAKAYNDAIDATGYYDEDQRLVVSFWDRLAGSYWAFEGKQYPKICEIKAKKAMPET
ncbi:hypothetical protein [Paracoccus onubensis]|uniref:SMODS and SLOG-associating 2TM effector domain-containing protein n=1 Tax=Paracoccus onubensis TaxID=1675788 RepID=A0A418SSY3_9RHOB|nr:hypothetical protein [Paracoccus onubensis]RJE84009.1 hypothetical protein D3P04_13410 [Paracoccus onubensis]